ncbi:hypothetical protein NCC49_006093 [Naganishia albida]|nr:hypothetical protein NCC49_006093 [Naganishia albida]
MAPPVRTFMDVSIGQAPPNRIIFELFVDRVPKTVENFRALCTGEKGISRLSQQALHYKGSIIHRVIPGFMAQGGDFTKRNGTGGESIYGGTFADEDLSMPVDKEGLLVMANRGPDTNGSQFFITFAPSPHLNGKHCVFGRVVRGFEHVQAIEKVQVDDRDRPLSPVTIVNCGELVLAKKANAAPKAEESRRSVSPSSTASRSPRRRRRSSVSDSDSSASDSEEERRRRKKKEKKSKKKDKKRDRDGKKDKLRGLVGDYKETEEELDARLEREENERIAAAKKEKMEQLKRQLEEEKRSQADGGVVYRGRGAMKYRDPENSSGRGSFADTDRSFGRPRAYDGVPRPERRHYDRRDQSDRRDDAHRRSRSRSRERGRADADDWRMGRKQTLEGRMADRSPVRFAKAAQKSPSPVAPVKRSPSPVKQRRGEMLTDSESEMELDED